MLARQCDGGGGRDERNKKRETVDLMNTEYKNLITVYTQWNRIIAHENYFCVAHSNKGKYVLLIHAYAHARTACFGSIQSHECGRCEQSWYLWLECEFVLIYARSDARQLQNPIQPKSVHTHTHISIIRHTDVFNSYFCNKRMTLILFVLFLSGFFFSQQCYNAYRIEAIIWFFIKSVLFKNEFKFWKTE